MKFNTLSERLKHLLDKTGLSSYQLCKKINISQSTISRILNKNTKPNASNLQSICSYFKVSEEWLLTGNDNKLTNEVGKSGFEIEIEKIINTKFEVNQANIDDKFEYNQKEIEDLNTKLSVISDALSKIILEIEENKALKKVK